MSDSEVHGGLRPAAAGNADAEAETSLLDLLLPLAANWRLVAIGPLLIGALALALSYLVEPVFTARTSFLPPQQQQTAASAALSQLGALAGLAGGAVGIKTPADQYIALMRSENIADRIIDRFGLMGAYDAEFRFEARRDLAKNVRIALGRKDGLITVEVDDTDPKRAADIANHYVGELGRLTSELALTDAQQRRAFFESQLKQTRDRLVAAQQALQASGFNAGALRAEPRAAAESYARLLAEITAAEVRLQTLRRGLADSSTEVQQQLALLAALRAQAARVEATTGNAGASETNSDYIGKYREFKYQETLFDLFSRQFELARLDESREGALIQVIDVATVPERKSSPRRALIGLLATAVSFVLLAAFAVLRHFWIERLKEPEVAATVTKIRTALRGE